MTRNYILATAGLAATLLAGGLTAASAQVLVTSGGYTQSGNLFTYSYIVNPNGSSVNNIVFNFSDANEFLITTPTGYTNTGVTNGNLSGGNFTFNGFNQATQSGVTTMEAFQFTSTDGPTGSTLVTGASGAKGGYFFPGIVPAPGASVAATPEPSQTAAFGLGVLGLAGLAFTARRRALRA